mmetsp:Transcript_37048/g.96042  ORF Transcript_37048/g.96042 Transcript_37048/m.96042 type:complete len:297 (-) Transcript_37048:628-1518(-)
MIINSGKRIAKAGDTICIYEGPTRSAVIRLEFGGLYQCRFGIFQHEDFIDQQYGSKIFGRNKKGGERTKAFVHFCKLTAELWTELVPHRTQIIYASDISTIVSRLELRPGSVVVEAGTGSGSLSHSLARAVFPSGKVYTFEYHEERQKKAQQEFEEHGLSDVVVSAHRDVCTDGFEVENANALFLDVPSPWLAVEHAKKALCDGGMFASYSPCIEQVQRTCDQLRKHGFVRVETVETKLYDYKILHRHPVLLSGASDDDAADGSAPKRQKLVEAVPEGDQRGHTAYLTFAKLVLEP